MLFLEVTLFWTSFLLIGYSLLGLLQKKYPQHFSWLYSLPLAGRSILYFSTGLAPFAPIVVLGILANFTVWVLVVYYLLLLVLALCYACLYMRPKINRITIPQSVIPALLLVAVMYVLDIYHAVVMATSQMQFDGDVVVQVGMITRFTNGHLSLVSPFFSTNGVLEPRYSFNLLNSLSAVATSLLHIPSYQFWILSTIFFRLLAWLAICAAIWVYLRDAVPTAWLLVSFASLPIMLGWYFGPAFLPDRYINIWIGLVLIGLYLWSKHLTSFVLILASVMISLTHAMYALFFTLLICMISVGCILFKNLLKHDVRPLVWSLAILAVPVMINLALPNRVANDERAFNAGTIFGREPTTLYWHGLQLPHMSFNGLVVFVGWVLLAYLIWRLREKTTNRLLKQISLLSILALLCITYNPIWGGIIAYYYLLISTKTIRLRIVLACVLAFNAIFIYNPIVLTIAYEKIPNWLLARTAQVNIFAYIAGILGFMYVLKYILKDTSITKYVAYIALIALLCINQFNTITFSTTLSDFHKKPICRGFCNFENDIKPFTATLSNHLVYMNSTDESMYLSMYAPVSVIAVPPANTSPMVNTLQRKRCFNILTDKMPRDELLASKVDYVFINRNLKNAKHIESQLETFPEVRLYKEANNYRLYSVEQSGVDIDHSFNCTIPYGQ